MEKTPPLDEEYFTPQELIGIRLARFGCSVSMPDTHWPTLKAKIKAFEEQGGVIRVFDTFDENAGRNKKPS